VSRFARVLMLGFALGGAACGSGQQAPPTTSGPTSTPPEATISSVKVEILCTQFGEQLGPDYQLSVFGRGLSFSPEAAADQIYCTFELVGPGSEICTGTEAGPPCLVQVNLDLEGNLVSG
jgi:hypothetical protein